MVAQKISIHDAIEYVNTVKYTFQDKPQIYDDFLELTSDFRAKRVETDGVILRLKELFKGQHELLLGFNTFLPKAFEITLGSDQNPTSFEKAVDFITKVKIRFQDDEHLYRSFLDIMNAYRTRYKPITEVYEEVTNIFRNHHDLLVEFTRFLPQTLAISSIMPQHGI